MDKDKHLKSAQTRHPFSFFRNQQVSLKNNNQADRRLFTEENQRCTAM